MNSQQDSDKQYKNNNFVKLSAQCAKKGYDVVLELDSDKTLHIEVIDSKRKLVSRAELVREDETIEKASDRIYKRLLKEEKIESTRPKPS